MTTRLFHENNYVDIRHNIYFISSHENVQQEPQQPGDEALAIHVRQTILSGACQLTRGIELLLRPEVQLVVL